MTSMLSWTAARELAPSMRTGVGAARAVTAISASQLVHCVATLTVIQLYCI